MTRLHRTSALLLVLLLALAIVLAVSPAAVFATGVNHTGAWYWVPYSGGMITIVGHDPYSGVLTIPKTLEVDVDDNRTFVEIGADAFKDMSDLTGVVLPATLLSIGTGAFQGRTSLEYATIPVDVNVLSARVFMDCTLLDTV